MPFADIYRRQVTLLLRALPHVASEECFALKGGTAINLFIREMPRLSVDIDLTYLPVEARLPSLVAIDLAMKRIAGRLRLGIPGSQVTEVKTDEAVTRLFVRTEGVQIKVEVTPVLRGCVYQPELRAVSPTVEDSFGFAEIKVVSFPDLYAGKIVAALDRQQPRDLFDARDLLANEGNRCCPAASLHRLPFKPRPPNVGGARADAQGFHGGIHTRLRGDDRNAGFPRRARGHSRGVDRYHGRRHAEGASSLLDLL